MVYLGKINEVFLEMGTNWTVYIPVVCLCETKIEFQFCIFRFDEVCIVRLVPGKKGPTDMVTPPLYFVTQMGFNVK